MSDPMLEQRLAKLEDAAAVSGPEGARLADSVERLGLNATALQQALLQVDRNQQALTQLGTQLAIVESSAATKNDLASTKAEQELQAREFGAATLRRTYLIGLLLFAGIALSALVVSEVLQARTANQVAVCEQRNKQTRLIVEVLRKAGGPAVRPDADRFEQLIIDCEREFGL